MVKSYTPNHNCVRNIQRVRAANSTFLARELVNSLRLSLRLNRNMDFKAMETEVVQKYGIRPSYMQLYRAKVKATEMLDGTHGKSYRNLRMYGL